jgi:hypothetical protein
LCVCLAATECDAAFLVAATGAVLETVMMISYLED